MTFSLFSPLVLACLLRRMVARVVGGLDRTRDAIGSGAQVQREKGGEEQVAGQNPAAERPKGPRD
jgi:hypothetical protein